MGSSIEAATKAVMQVQGAVAATLAAMVVREAMAAMAEVGTWESRRCTTRDTSV